jgi:hypothetical protein
MTMKNLFALVLSLLVGWISAGSVMAMTPGPIIIHECPHCQAPLCEFTLGSGNTIGARYWSDDKMDAPMLPEFPWLVKCPKCKGAFWIDEAKKLGEEGLGAMPQKKWGNAPATLAADAADMQTMLAKSKLSKAKEVYLRKHLWWQANDKARCDVKVVVKFTPEQQKNLQTLASLMDEKNEPERILKAEIFRELGDFDHCTALLAKPFITEGREEWAACLRKLAAQKVKGVREIKPEENSQTKKPSKPVIKTGK